MKWVPVLKIVAFLAGAVFICLCCSTISEIRSGSGSGVTLTIPLWNNSHVVSFDANLTKGGEAWVYVVSDRPIDILVMDRNNFSNYYATEQGNASAWTAYAVAVNVTVGGLNYTAPSDGNYLFIIDNTPLNAGGAPGDTWANYSVKYAYHWNHYPVQLNWLFGN